MPRTISRFAYRSCKRFILCAVVMSIAFSASTKACAQVFDPGPSDSTLFDTVINIPPSDDIGFNQSIGSSTQLNLFAGGSLGSFFNAGSGSEVNISGGSLGGASTANSGSEVNISNGFLGSTFDASTGSFVNVSGGSVGFGFDAFPGSTVNISGGSFGFGFNAQAGSNVELAGSDFQLNGVSFTETNINLSGTGTNLFTGVFADGTPFVFANERGDQLNGVSLSVTSLPPVDTTPIVIDSIGSPSPLGLRAGQSLTVTAGGMLGGDAPPFFTPNFVVLDSVLNIDGGEVASSVDVVGGTFNISGGVIQPVDLRLLSGSETNISGGTVDAFINAGFGSVLNISGGFINRDLRANSGSELNVSGGVVGNVTDDIILPDPGSVVNVTGGTVFFGFLPAGSEVNISGGVIDGPNGGINASEGAIVSISGGVFSSIESDDLSGNVEFQGGEFRLNGQSFSESTVSLNAGDIFTGTLADGSPFIISPSDTLALANLVDTVLFHPF